MNYSLTTIHKLIAEAFDDEELHTFCQGHFEEVIDYFAPEMGKRTKVRILVEYCDRREELDDLLKKVKAKRPRKYEKFEAQLESGKRAPSERTRDLETKESSMVIKILFLAANPSDTTRLRLDEESRSIDQAIRQAEFRDKFDIRQHWAVRVSEIQGLLLRHKPDIVHFSGHGSQSSEIILEDNFGNRHPVSADALDELFSLRKGNIRCVVLNACYSEQQARAIAEHIDCVIGMSKAIGDASAISFATAFYQSLGYGEDVNTAFKSGCLQINLENLGEQDTPKLLAVKSDPEKIVFVPNEEGRSR